MLCLTLGQAQAVTLKEARQLYATGEYAKAIKASEAAIAANEYDSGWRLLLRRVRLTTGEYPEARQFATELLKDYRYRSNAEALWLFHLAYEANGDAAEAGQMLQAIMQFLNGQRGISDENTLIFIGRALLKAAATDPKQVK
ncbi:MAG TPA: tetratricopeptide repeat protein, partial [Verrucomicrobiota bacterium]|nr:tetratricopeptide repeat protein [Verrucomicrobiota bacterium]